MMGNSLFQVEHEKLDTLFYVSLLQKYFLTSLDLVYNYGSGDLWCKWKSAICSYNSGGTYGSKGNQSSGKLS